LVGGTSHSIRIQRVDGALDVHELHQHAVVRNNGALLAWKHGVLIDDSGMVIRRNNAPTREEGAPDQPPPSLLFGGQASSPMPAHGSPAPALLSSPAVGPPPRDVGQLDVTPEELRLYSTRCWRAPPQPPLRRRVALAQAQPRWWSVTRRRERRGRARKARHRGDGEQTSLVTFSRWGDGYGEVDCEEDCESVRWYFLEIFPNFS
jgi:hypothetical protein